MTWSAENQQRAADLIARYPDRRSAVMPRLYLASREHGYLTDAAMQEVAELTGMSAAQVQSAASFYTMFKREHVGKYLISVCTSISCMLCGGDEVLEAIEEASGAEDGETSSDDLFSIEHVECIGACGGAPAVQINYELIEGVTPEKGAALVKWLRDARPAVLHSDEMQELFGGQRSFDWGPAEAHGAVAPVPAFEPYGSTEEA